MLNTQLSKSTLAKLLATENISVEYRKVQTASFDIVNRRLTLPILNDVTSEMTDLLVGHEVGHALDTPQSYVESAKAGGSAFSTFLNVIEDARIERKIKDRYPGLRKPMAIAYRQFTERDFFGIKGQDVNEFMLIDRINLHFKLGAIAGIKFNAEEMLYVKEVETADSFEQVKDITERLYEFCKAELDQKRQEAKEEFQKRKENGEFDDEEFDNEDGFGDDTEDYEDQNPNSSGSNDGEDDDDYESEDRFDNGYSNERTFEDTMPNELKVYGDEVKSVTDEKFQEALKGLAETKEINVGKIASQKKIYLKDYIVPFKELQFFDESFYDTEELEPHERYNATLLTKFESKNKNAIAYLIKEFEMKKKAAELRRVTVSDTGTLDTNKLHTYKFNDDIFRKIGAVADGKNHGIVMFIDWSGSMADNMSGTIEQLITMATFCRKVNIPFDVYAFSTQYPKKLKDILDDSPIVDTKDNELQIDYFSLLNILSSSMKNQTYRKFANDLLNVAEAYEPYSHHRRHNKSSYIKNGMGLGGTPLNATIQVASNVVNDFRKRTRSEIVNVIFLTDGEDSSTLWTTSADHRGARIGPSDYRSVSYIEDKDSAKTYRVSDKGVTPTLLQILKDRTGCNLIGFYILPKSKRYFQNAMSRFNMIMTDDGYKQFRNEKFFSVNGYGYSEYFLIPGGEDLSTEDDSLSDILGESKDVSARKLKGAFLKMNQNRLTNRVLLSKVIKEIA
jgi:hypothetical protein